MKISKKTLFLSLALIAVVAYAQESDEEVIEIQNEISIENESYDETDEYLENTLDDKKNTKKNSNAFLDFFKATNNHIVFCDETEITVPNALGKFKKQTGCFVCLNNDNYAGFCSPTAASYTYVFFNERTQKEFVNAGKSYFKDFENKKLDRKNISSERKYGNKYKTKIMWGPNKNQAKSSGVTDAWFGYKFKDKSPYFVITLPVTLNEKYDSITDSLPRESVYTQFFFTKAQLKSLIDFIENFDFESVYYEEKEGFDNKTAADVDEY